MALHLNYMQTILLVLILAKIVEVDGAEPVQAHIFLDDKVQKEGLVDSVLQNLPDGSTMSGLENLHGDSFLSASMDNETFTQFPSNQYKEMAEIVMIFVNTDTKIDSVPNFSKKKKTFVVVFGSSVPEIWNNTATDKNHLFLVTRESNATVIFERLMKQINIDSKYLCDIDMYSQKKGQKCKTCSNLCGTDPEQLSDACSLRCPYFWSKFKEEEIDVDSDSQPTPVVPYAVMDQKYTVLTVGLIILGVLVIGILITICVYISIKKKKQLTPRNSVTVPLTYAHQETERHSSSTGEEDGQSQTSERRQDDDHRMTRPDDCIVSLMDANGSSERDDGAGLSMPDLENTAVSVSFKNKREADLNAHYGDENVHSVH